MKFFRSRYKNCYMQILRDIEMQAYAILAKILQELRSEVLSNAKIHYLRIMLIYFFPLSLSLRKKTIQFYLIRIIYNSTCTYLLFLFPRGSSTLPFQQAADYI